MWPGIDQFAVCICIWHIIKTIYLILAAFLFMFELQPIRHSLFVGPGLWFCEKPDDSRCCYHDWIMLGGIYKG